MNQQALLQDISKYFSRFKEQITILNANAEFSINVHAENVLIKVLNIIYDCDFENLNYSEGKNYDSIDLGDKAYKMAIQVTSTRKIKKVKDTLSKYVKNEHYKSYGNLKILILTGRQSKYSVEAINDTVNKKFTFNQATDIIDFTTLYVKLSATNNLNKILAVKELLQEQFADVTQTEVDSHNIQSYEELKKVICEKLKITNQVFKDFGPNSGADSTEPLRWDLTLWYEARKEKLLPLNNFVAEIIEANTDLIPDDKRYLFRKYTNHVYAFNKHCEDADFDYTEYQFPKEIIKEVCE